VDKPVRVPIFPIRINGIVPRSVPSIITMRAVEYVISGTNSIPVNTVVTTTLDPSQRKKVENKLIVLSFAEIGLMLS
jgi:hypothetical protein